MKVCHVIHDLRRGGAEHLLVELAGAGAAAGLDLSVVSLMPSDGHGYAAALQRAGVPVHTVGLRNRWDPRAGTKLAGLLREIGPEVVHSHLKHADLATARAAGRLGIPMVSSLHVVEEEVGLLGRFKRGLAMRARDRSAARIVAVSAALRDWYLCRSDRDPATVVVLHNGVAAPPHFGAGHRSEMRRALGIPDTAVLCATAAILRPGKGIDDLLEASAASGEEVRFVIAGDGPEAGRLQAEARRRGLLGEKVVFAGFVDDVGSLLAAADLLVHPSRAEALPTALIHAMAAGLPVVATAVGGTPELVDRSHGILVPPADPAALGEAIGVLTSDPARRSRMAAEARERFAAEFEIGVWVEQLLDLYREVLAEADWRHPAVG